MRYPMSQDTNPLEYIGHFTTHVVVLYLWWQLFIAMPTFAVIAGLLVVIYALRDFINEWLFPKHKGVHAVVMDMR